MFSSMIRNFPKILYPGSHFYERNELQKFDKFLDKHRNIESDLRTNPGLVNDAQYLSSHKDLEKFLRKNPKITADLSSNPNYFMNRESRFQNQPKDHKHWRQH